MQVSSCVADLGDAAVRPNPIVLENAKAGSSEWRIGTAATEIEGYASLASAAAGESIAFYVNTAAPTFDVDVFRMGWYAGVGGRLVLALKSIPGRVQTAPLIDVRGMVECQLEVSFELAISDDWCTGIYLAKLTTGGVPQPLESYVTFVVRDDQTKAAFLFGASVSTYQAYNIWGGLSLYANLADVLDYSLRARAVSFDRPYEQDCGAGYFLKWEYSMLRWLERMGYDLTYATSLDLHRNASLLDRCSVYLSVGHDEYWSKEMRDQVEASRDTGLSLGFFGANAVYWQVRFEDASAAGSSRRMICYKDDAPASAPLAAVDPVRVTTRWQDPPVSRPEQALVRAAISGVLSYRRLLPDQICQHTILGLSWHGVEGWRRVAWLVRLRDGQHRSNFSRPRRSSNLG